MLKIGIECESIEDKETWGVGRIVKKLLEKISHRPELTSKFRFFLYFKSHVPDLACLDNPIFVKKVIGIKSFSLYYYLFLPIRLWFEGLDAMFFPNYMLPILFAGKSLVILTEDIKYEIEQGALPFRYKLAYKIFAGWAAGHATSIMAISETSEDEISRLFNIATKRIVVNQLGVDAPSKEEGLYLKPGNYILYVGQAFPRRHLRETMLAFEKIAPHFDGLQLIGIGKDKYVPPIIEKLKNAINKRLGGERIIYKEYVSENELHRFYAGAKLLVYVSSKEAFGLPPLEALSYGVPSVVAEQGPAREIFGDDAFFVKDSDVGSIAETIKDALNDDGKRQVIAANTEQILKKYTWQAHTDRFLEIIRSL